MEPPVMQIPIYLKILAVIGTVTIIFLLAAWELVTEWIARCTGVFVKALKSKPPRKRSV